MISNISSGISGSHFKALLSKLCVIRNDFIIVIIPQLKIGLIENLVLLSMAEQFQMVVVVDAGRMFLLI